MRKKVDAVAAAAWPAVTGAWATALQHQQGSCLPWSGSAPAQPLAALDPEQKERSAGGGMTFLYPGDIQAPWWAPYR